MKKALFFTTVILCVLFTGCPTVLVNKIYDRDDTSSSEYEPEVHESEIELTAELVSTVSSSDGSSYREVKAGNEFGLKISGKLDFTKFNYYNVSAEFQGYLQGMDFVDDGSRLVEPMVYNIDQNKKVTLNSVFFKCEEWKCMEKDRISDGVYSFERTIPVSTGSTGTNKIIVTFSTDTGSYDRKTCTLKIRTVSP